MDAQEIDTIRLALEDALQALERDAAAIGAAQTAGDIDWFKFGEATVLKQSALIPLRRALEILDAQDPEDEHATVCLGCRDPDCAGSCYQYGANVPGYADVH